MSNNQLTSIRRITSRYVFIVMLVTLVTSLISFLIYRDYLVKQHHNDQIQSIYNKAEAISNTIKLYYRTIESRSKQRNLVNYILFSEREKAREWAEYASPILPHNMGLALFNEDGELLGEPDELRVGQRCLADMRRTYQGEKISNPPIHRNVAGLEHIDIVVKLHDEEEITGVVFASFSLALIQEELESITNEGQYLKVLADDGYVIAESNHIHEEDRTNLELNLPIDGTDWTLHARIKETEMGGLMGRLITIKLSIFLAICAILIVFSQRLSSMFAADFRAVHNLIASLKEDRELEFQQSNLKETRHIFDNVSAIAAEIKNYQQQLLTYSNTDILTGLSNRRDFNNRMAHYIALSNRGIDTCLVLLDVDHFKQINDTHGHVTGDEVLSTLSRCIQENIREIDMAARIGGDEFAVVLAQCPADNVYRWYEKLADDFRRSQEKIEDLRESGKRCTLSAGFLLMEREHESLDEIVQCADSAMYEVKSSGRNAIRQYGETEKR